MNLSEIWMPILGYEGLYEVSNRSRVRSLDRRVLRKDGFWTIFNGKILSPKVNNQGYLYVNLSKNGIVEHAFVHRLVAQAFIPNPENKPCIDHKDGNQLNNDADNLRWCTYKENSNFELCRKRRSESMKGKMINRNDLSTPILQYKKDGTFVNEYPSIAEANRTTGIPNATICRCCNGKGKSAGGYLWKYKDGVG